MGKGNIPRKLDFGKFPFRVDDFLENELFRRFSRNFESISPKLLTELSPELPKGSAFHDIAFIIKEYEN